MAASARILCVDDNQDTREMINLLLQQAGESYSVTAVATAEHALELSKKQPFDLYILDYRLPEMSGVELCSCLRQKGFTTPIMFFTARAFDADRRTALEAGATDYLIKPNDLKRFTQTVRKLVGKDTSNFAPDAPLTENYYNNNRLW